MKQVKQYEQIDNIAEPANEPRPQDTNEPVGEASSIAEICVAIAKLVTAVSTAGAEPGRRTGFADLTEGQTDAVWDSVCDFASQLAHTRSSSLDDISGKIAIWRHLAPEQSDEDNYQTVDETLLSSIMNDVEWLRSLRAG